MFTGGYTYLHRDLPIFEAYEKHDIAGLTPYVNAYLVMAPAVPGIENVKTFQGFTQDRCIDEMCVYRRPGGCKEMPGYSLNKFMAGAGR